MKAGYLKDALKYLEASHETNPGDFGVMLKLGWTYNLLHQDPVAVQWFDLARKSPDAEISQEANGAWRGLRQSQQTFRTTVWLYPSFSSWWNDLFGYAQTKTEMTTGSWFVPYISIRLIGDVRGLRGTEHLSESSVIPAAGIRTLPWHRITFWGEAGWAVNYLNKHVLPDYRGGFSTSRATGAQLSSEHSGAFADVTLDGVFISRFGNDCLAYEQARAGYTLAASGFRTQAYVGGNLTIDARSQAWANIGQTGPGIRFRMNSMPASMYFTANWFRGEYLKTGRAFNDLQAGAWYAFSY